MNKSITKNNKGFSLLELIIYIAVLSSLLTITVNMFTMISSNSTKQYSRIEVQQNLQFSVNEITSQFNNYNTGISIITPANNGETGNILELIIDGKNIKYDVSSGILQKTIDSSTKNITSETVIIETINPIFKKINDTIQINLKISYNDRGKPSSKHTQEIKTTISVKK